MNTTLKANKALHALGLKYHNGIPNAAIDDTLTASGFKPLEEGIYCGRDGEVREEVGDNVWFSMTWHKMEVTGRYEIVAYLTRGARRAA